MVTILRKWFIKDYRNVDDPNVRNAHGLLGAVFGLVSNGLLILLKLTAAILLAYSNNWIFPLALIAESVNNLSDLGSSLVTLIAFASSKKKADKEHPVGHKRAEYVAGLIVAVLVIVAGARLFIDSLQSAIAGTAITYDLFAFIILGVSILLKLLQAYVNKSLGRLIHSKALELTALDSLLDVVATTTVLVTGIIGKVVGFPYLDPYAGLFVSSIVLFSGIKAIKEAISPLLGSAYPKQIEDRVKAILDKYPEILGYHDFLCHEYGPGVLYLSFHAEMREDMPLKEAHEVIDHIEKEIEVELKASVTIHIDPVPTKDEALGKLKEQIASILASIDKDLSFHECHLDEEGLHIDIEVPFDKEEMLKPKIHEDLATLGYPLHITIDHPLHE